MEFAGQDCPDTYKELDEATRILRARLMLEETVEKIRKGLGIAVELQHNVLTAGSVEDAKFYIVGPFDPVETIDGCMDCNVISAGTMIAMGLPDLPFQQEVDDSNLRKFGPGGRRREDGKWLKPPNWTPPNIPETLRQFGG